MSNAEIKNFYLPLAAKQQLKDALRNDCPDPTGSNYNVVLSGHCRHSSCTARDCAIASVWLSVANQTEMWVVDKPCCQGDKCCLCRGHCPLGAWENLSLCPSHAKIVFCPLQNSKYQLLPLELSFAPAVSVSLVWTEGLLQMTDTLWP